MLSLRLKRLAIYCIRTASTVGLVKNWHLLTAYMQLYNKPMIILAIAVHDVHVYAVEVYNVYDVSVQY